MKRAVLQFLIVWLAAAAPGRESVTYDVAGVQAQPLVRPGDFRISLDVEMVVLDASVTDKKGRFISGLQKEHFQVFEDGRPQEIRVFHNEDVPVDAGLIVDNSGSMGSKRRHVVAASLAFTQSSNPNDEMFVINFNERVSMGLPANRPFASDAEPLRQALTRDPPAGQTALYDALAAGLDHLKKGRHNKKVLLVVSDGGDNASRISFRQALRVAQRSNAIIYTIGLTDPHNKDQNPSVLKRLARETGGQAYLPDQIGEVMRITRRIAEDIRNQYTLGYVPREAGRTGAYHAIKVVVQAPGHKNVKVRTRAGYFEPAQEPPKGESRP